MVPPVMAPVGVFRLRRLCLPSGCRLGKGFPSAIATPADDVLMEMDPTQDASDETRSRLMGLSQPTYVVLVSLKTNSLRTEDGDTMLEPGVAVTAEIKTGKRMVMSYCSHRFSGSDRRDCERDEHGASLLDLWFIFMGCLPGLQGVFVKRTFRPEARELARVASIRNIFHFFALLMISWADVVHAGDAVSENGAPHHETPSCRAAVAALHRDDVVFYSSLGQRLATCLKIQPPPLVRLPLSQVDPDRHVPAKLWRSPMCDRWNDATTMCERDRTRKGTPVVRCRPLSRSDIPWHDVLCTSPSITSSRYCARQAIYVVDIVNGEKRRFFHDDDHSGLVYRIKHRRWEPSFADTSYNATHGVVFSYDNTCKETYSFDQKTSIYSSFEIEKINP